MRLYHHPFSSNARRAVMTSVHLGLPTELVLVDLAKAENRTPAFLKLNPSGKVPVLDDDGFVLTESHAIMQYLADGSPSAARGEEVYPKELRARADVNRWLFWSAYHWTTAVGTLTWEHVIKPMLGLGAADPAMVKRGEDQVTECSRLLEAHLDGKRWIAQDRLTLADFALATPLAVITPSKLPVTQCTNLMAWLGRVQETDAWKKTGP